MEASGTNPDTSGSSLGNVYDEIRHLFSWNPPSLVMRDHVPSDRTRNTKGFDSHLNGGQVLEWLAVLPSLPDLFGKVADSALEDFEATTFNDSLSLGKLSTSAGRETATTELGIYVKNEEDVKIFYEGTTAQFCAPVASTLALSSTPSSIKSAFRFTSSVASKSSADPDGALEFHMGNITPEMGISPEKCEQLQNAVRYFGAPALYAVLVEFKSLKAGSEGFMKAIIKLAKEPGKFPYQRCLHGACGSRCVTSSGSQVVTGAKMGPDARSSPWGPSIAQLRKATGKQTSTSRKRKQSDIDSDLDEDDSTTSPTQTERQHAMDVLQQVWGEFVQGDGTLAVINSGIYDIIAVRDRKTQTLYVSELIHTPTAPNYGKIHTGIYIAGINDLLDRAEAIHAATIANRLPKSWTRTSWSTKSLSVRQKEQLFNMSYNSTTADIFSKPTGRGNGFVLSFTGKRPLKLDRKILYTRNQRTTNLKRKATGKTAAPTIRLLVEEEIAPFVYPATLSVAGKFLDEHVIIKVAHDDNQLERLQREANTYRELQKRGVKSVVDVIGFYQSLKLPDRIGVFTALVMRKFGERPTRGQVPKEKFFAALDAIHKAGLLHGRLRPTHLLARGKKVAIIAFGDSCTREEVPDLDESSGTTVVGSRFERRAKNERSDLGIILDKYF